MHTELMRAASSTQRAVVQGGIVVDEVAAVVVDEIEGRNVQVREARVDRRPVRSPSLSAKTPPISAPAGRDSPDAGGITRSNSR